MSSPEPFGEGTVSVFIPDEGFGFIAPSDGTRAVFVHFTAVEGDGPGLREGQRVAFVVGPRRPGRSPEARRVWPI